MAINLACGQRGLSRKMSILLWLGVFEIMIKLQIWSTHTWRTALLYMYNSAKDKSSIITSGYHRCSSRFWRCSRYNLSYSATLWKIILAQIMKYISGFTIIPAIKHKAIPLVDSLAEVTCLCMLCTLLVFITAYNADQLKNKYYSQIV